MVRGVRVRRGGTPPAPGRKTGGWPTSRWCIHGYLLFNRYKSVRNDGRGQFGALERDPPL